MTGRAYYDAGRLNVRAASFGAAGDGTTDDTAAIQAALNTGQPVYLPAGTYKITAPLTMATGQAITGDGPQLTVIRQANPAAHGIYADNSYQMTIRGMTIQGPGSGSGDGIHWDQSGQVPVNCLISDVIVTRFGGNGVFINTPVTTVLLRTETRSNGGHGFYLENGTSCSLIGCYSNGDAQRGYNLSAMSYSALHGCAADSSGSYGYVLTGTCRGITLNGCGAESQAAGGAFDLIGAIACVLNACYSLANPGVALNINSSSAAITVNSFEERSPAGGATASISVSAGSAAVIIHPSVTTAASYASGSTYVITSAGGTAH